MRFWWSKVKLPVQEVDDLRKAKSKMRGLNSSTIECDDGLERWSRDVLAIGYGVTQ